MTYRRLMIEYNLILTQMFNKMLSSKYYGITIALDLSTETISELLTFNLLTIFLIIVYYRFIKLFCII